jgi:hypothetical protein
MPDEAVLDEIQENTKEAGQLLRASLSLLHSQGMIDDGDYRELVMSEDFSSDGRSGLHGGAQERMSGTDGMKRC